MLPLQRTLIGRRHRPELTFESTYALRERHDLGVAVEPRHEQLGTFGLQLADLCEQRIDRRTLQECRISGEVSHGHRARRHLSHELLERTAFDIVLADTRSELARPLE